MIQVSALQIDGVEDFLNAFNKRKGQDVVAFWHVCRLKNVR